MSFYSSFQCYIRMMLFLILLWLRNSCWNSFIRHYKCYKSKRTLWTVQSIIIIITIKSCCLHWVYWRCCAISSFSLCMSLRLCTVPHWADASLCWSSNQDVRIHRKVLIMSSVFTSPVTNSFSFLANIHIYQPLSMSRICYKVNF